MSCIKMTLKGTKCKRTALKNGMCKQHGCGFDRISKAIVAIREGPASRPTSRLAKFMNENKSKITKIQLGRSPLKLTPVLNAISLGRFGKKQKELKYDDVWHSYILVTLASGEVIKLEKNAVVQEVNAAADDYNGELVDIPLKGRDTTIQSLVQNAARGHETELFKYRAGSNNCQKFVRDIVERNGLMPDDSSALLQQDAGTLLDTLPGQSNLANLITDAAAVGDRLLHGDGLTKNILSVRKRKKPFYNSTTCLPQ